jgi:hypothetical protein
LIRALARVEYAFAVHRGKAGAFAGRDIEQVLHFERARELDHAEHNGYQDRRNDGKFDGDDAFSISDFGFRISD